MTALTTEADRTDTGRSRPLTQRQLRIVFGGLMLGMLLAALDQTIVATALPDDRRRPRRPRTTCPGWSPPTCWPRPRRRRSGASSATCTAASGIFQAAIVIFLVGSALCGLSQNMGQLIAFRALQGLGGGGLMVAAHGDHRRPRPAARARPLPGLLRRRVRRRQRRRAAARRLLHRPPELALDLLHQPAARRRRAGRGHRARCSSRSARRGARIDYLGAALLAAGAHLRRAGHRPGAAPSTPGARRRSSALARRPPSCSLVAVRGRRAARPASRSCRCTCSATASSPWPARVRLPRRLRDVRRDHRSCRCTCRSCRAPRRPPRACCCCR